jgi:hypothetical protein
MIEIRDKRVGGVEFSDAGLLIESGDCLCDGDGTPVNVR